MACQSMGGACDPLDELTATGVRVSWVGDFDKRVLLIRDDALVIADVSLTRRSVADRALALIDGRLTPPRQ